MDGLWTVAIGWDLLGTMTAWPLGLVLTKYQFGLYDDAGDVEQAEFGLWAYQDPAHLSTDWDADLALLAQTAYESWVTRADTAWFTSFVKLDKVTASTFMTNSHTLAEQIYIPGTLWAGDASTGGLPWQVALRVGIYSYTPGTFIPNARRRRGGVNLPPMAKGMADNAANGALTNANVIAACTLIKNLMLDIEALTLPDSPDGSGLHPGVFSRGPYKNDPDVVPRIWEVTDLASDNKWDTQRRRTRSQEVIKESVSY